MTLSRGGHWLRGHALGVLGLEDYVVRTRPQVMPRMKLVPSVVAIRTRAAMLHAEPRRVVVEIPSNALDFIHADFTDSPRVDGLLVIRGHPH